MPEKVTPEERLISLAIEKAREVKEAITEANGIDFPIDDKVEMEKVKRPKAQKDTSKIDMQTEEGFGLGGALVKKELDLKGQIMRVSEQVAQSAENIKQVATDFEKYKNTIPATLYNRQQSLKKDIETLQQIIDRYDN